MASLEGAILKDKGDGYVSDEEAKEEETSSVPPPTYDGMPQVSEKLLGVTSETAPADQGARVLGVDFRER